jgi:flagellar M-ring protein FliF
MLDYQHAVERTAEERIESMLGTVVGREGVIARVSAQLDFARAERTEERFDPDGAVVKTQQNTKEETTGAKVAGGAPGTQSNLTNDPIAVEAPQGPSSHRKEEQQTFEISKIVSRTIAPVGSVQQMSVAVLVDGTWKEENGERTFVPRPQDELDRLKELVKSAVGFNEERGDRVEITSAPFQTPEAVTGDGVISTVGRWAPSVLTRLLGVAFVALALLYVVKPLLMTLAQRRSLLGSNGEIDTTDMTAAMAQLTQENLQLTQRNPERAAQLVREWLYEDADATTRQA